MSFSPESDALPLLVESLGFFPGQMPAEQLVSFLWASYFVGMEVPGLQALFFSFSFLFRAGRPSQFLDLNKIAITCAPEFQRWTINATDPEVGDFELVAFRRPESITHSFTELAAATTDRDALSGKKIVVCGASRGFGAALTYALAASGARALAIVRTVTPETQEIEKVLCQVKAPGAVLVGDLTKIADCDRLANSIKASESEVDCLILNAAPPILPSLFLDQKPDAWLTNVEKLLQPVINPCSSLLPLVRKGGHVVFLSSIYASEGKREFSHYSAAKAAIEGMVKSLAHEFPKLNFIIVRPRPMLTDQTATAIPMESLTSAVKVAVELAANIASDNPLKEITLPAVFDD